MGRRSLHVNVERTRRERPSLTNIRGQREGITWIKRGGRSSLHLKLAGLVNREGVLPSLHITDCRKLSANIEQRRKYTNAYATRSKIIIFILEN